jgi:hypothetical protein
MGAGDGGVDADVPGDQPSRVRLGLQTGEDLLPGAVALPAAEQPVDGLPRSVPCGHIAPRRARAGPPADPVDQLSLAPPGWPARLLALGQQRLQPGPLLVGEVSSSHSRSISPHLPTSETHPNGHGRGAGAATALAAAARARAALGVLIITVQVMLVFAYRNLGKTTVTYGTATDVVTGLARVQRETLNFAIELERLRLPDGLDKLAVRRGLLDQQIDVTLGSVPPGGVEREGLERAHRQLKSFDAELARLRADPTPAQLARSRPVLEGHVDAVQVTLKELYDVSEITFGSIDDALRARTNLERC